MGKWARFRRRLREWREGWLIYRNLPDEYEELARECAQLTARCLESEQHLAERNRRVLSLWETIFARDKRIGELERERAAMCSDVPGLTPGELERLAILSENCGKVLWAVAKIQRFGYESSSPYGGRVNREALERELGAVRAIVNLMIDCRDLSLGELQGWQKSKRMALAKWTLYQECSMDRDEQLAMMAAIADERK